MGGPATPGGRARATGSGTVLLWNLLLAIGVVLLCAPPLLTRQLLYDHDTLSSTLRFVYAADGLDQGLWSWRWLPTMGRGYGYPLFNYYPPLATQVGVLLRAATGSLALAKGLHCLLGLALGWAGVFVWLRRHPGPMASLAATLYTLAPYHLVVVFVRGALSEALALGLLPWVLWATDRAVESRSPVRLAAAATLWAGVILTHNITAMVFGAVLLLRGAWLSLGKGALRPLLITSAVFLTGLGLSAFFWIPALGEHDAVQIDRVVQGPSHYASHFVAPAQLLKRTWGWGWSVPGTGDGMSFQIGWAHVAVLVCSAFLWLAWRRLPRDQRYETAFWQGVVLVTIFLMVRPSAWVWHGLPALQFVQFPWRLLGLLLLAAAALTAPLFALLGERTAWLAASALLLATGILYAPYCQGRYLPPDIAAPLTSSQSLQLAESDSLTTTTHQNEFLPVSVESYPLLPPSSAFVVPAGVEVESFRRHGNDFSFRLRHDRPIELAVHQFLFPGWRATVNGSPVAVRPVGPHGVIGVEVPDSGTSEVRVWFGNTLLRTAAFALSLLTLCGLAVAVAWRRRPSGLLDVPAR